MADEPKTDARQADHTRERLLSAGLELLCKKGYRGATTREIAQEAGVTEVTMYRHFRSKEELLATAVSDHGAQFLNIFPKPTGDMEADLLTLAQGFMDALSSLPARLTRILPELSQQEDLLNALNDVTRRFREKGLELFRYYQDSGELRDDVDDVLFAAFTGPLHLRVLGGPAATEFSCQRFVALFLDGCRAAKPGEPPQAP